jgi:hypothetical protein
MIVLSRSKNAADRAIASNNRQARNGQPGLGHPGGCRHHRQSVWRRRLRCVVVQVHDVCIWSSAVQNALGSLPPGSSALTAPALPPAGAVLCLLTGHLTGAALSWFVLTTRSVLRLSSSQGSPHSGVVVGHPQSPRGCARTASAFGTVSLVAVMGRWPNHG